MRASIRAYVNQTFIRHPKLGHVGYDFLRVSGLDRSTRTVKKFFKKLARHGFYPQVIVDVGANHGGWSREVSYVFKTARFFLIEPQEEMQPFLDHFCSQAEGSRWFLGGAGAEVGHMELTLWDDYQGSAFLSRDVEAMLPDLRQRAVPVFTLDNLIGSGEMPIPDLIKIDVQGYEIEVLKGSMRCFGKTDVIIVETSLFHPLDHRPSFYRVLELMEAYGYAVYDLPDFKYRRDGALVQIDVCFVRRQSALALKLHERYRK
ncbi:MAG: FkbM family methyltransferase [Candidatus Promineifilaceae bacterium]|jgi:FkbM family methyltransferase